MNHQKILLSESASKHLLEAGSFFAVIGRGSYPEHDGTRLVIHVLPCDYQTAAAAVEVATGARKPGKRITAPAIATDEPQAPSRAGKCPATETTHQDHLPT
jgi:hypothetical protein